MASDPRGTLVHIRIDSDSVVHISAANNLSEEVILEIFEWLCPNPALDYHEHPGNEWQLKNVTLMSLQLCNRLFYKLVTPIRMRNVRISMLNFTNVRKFSKMVHNSRQGLAPLIKDIRFDFKDRHRRREARLDRVHLESWRKTCEHRLEKLSISENLSNEVTSKLRERIEVMSHRPGVWDRQDHVMAMVHIDIEVLLILVALTSLRTIEFRLDPEFLDMTATRINNWQVLRKFFSEDELDDDPYLPDLRRILYTSSGRNSGSYPRVDNREFPLTDPDTVVTTFSGHGLELNAVDFPKFLAGFMVQDDFAHIDLIKIATEHELLRNVIATLPGAQAIRLSFIHPGSMGDLLPVPWWEPANLSNTLNARAASRLRSLVIHEWSKPENGWDSRHLTLAGMHDLVSLEVPAALLFGTGHQISTQDLGTLIRVLPSKLERLSLCYTRTDGIPVGFVEPFILALMQASAEFPQLHKIALMWTAINGAGAKEFVNKAAQYGWVDATLFRSAVTRLGLKEGYCDLNFYFSRRLT